MDDEELKNELYELLYKTSQSASLPKILTKLLQGGIDTSEFQERDIEALSLTLLSEIEQAKNI